MAIMNEKEYELIKEESVNNSEIKTNEIFSKIRMLRVKENLSQSEVSRRSGVPQKTISRMDNGLSYPSVSTLIKIVDAMGYDMEVNFIKKGELK